MESEPPLLSFCIVSIFFLAMQMWSLLGGIGLLLLLLLCSALISGAEVAFFSLSPKDQFLLKESKTKTSIRITRLRENPKSLLATILISNNFVNIAIVIIADYILRNLFTESVYSQWAKGTMEAFEISWMNELYWVRIYSFLVTIVLITFILVLLGEVTPKVYANMHNLQFAKIMSFPLSILTKLLGPVSSVLVRFTHSLEASVYKNRSIRDKKELDKAIELAVSNDMSPENEEVDILKGIIKFGDVTVKQIMKSRVDVVAAEYNTNFKELMQIIRDSGYSRIPVFKEDFDNIEGILYVKDLLGHTEKEKEFNWQKLIRMNLLYVPEAKKINELLKEFQQKRLHMAIVVDEYGGSSGIVTLEDIMEEVIGEIKDEFDDESEVEYLKINENNYIFEGKTLLNDVCRIMGIETDTFDEIRGDSDSLAGLILELIGYIPKIDKEIVFNQFKFKVIARSKRRIEKINISINPE